MRKAGLIAVLMAVVFVAAVAEAQDSRLKRILDTGVLRAGITGAWNPMSVRDPASGGYKGFDADFFEALAADLGVKLEYVATDYKTIIAGILADKYDITGSLSVTPARAKVVGYSDSYLEVATVPLTLADKIDRFKSWEGINKPDVVVAATLGTTQEQQVKQFFPDAQHAIIEQPARDFQEVLAGRADAHITSNVEASMLVAQYPQMAIVPVQEGRLRTPIAMVLPQDDQIWINYVNTWIKSKKARGFFRDLSAKWKISEAYMD